MMRPCNVGTTATMNTPHAAERRWYDIANADEIPSPALVVYPDRIEENIRRMIRTAGNPARLRPHVKTHKTAEIVAMQMKQGIAKFKCATIAEAEMTAACGARDVLLAMQPVGPAVGRFFALKARFPGSAVSAIVDSEPVIEAIATMAASVGTNACLWIDVNAGMNRTGVAPGAEAVRLYRMIHERPGLEVGGLHVYDGNIHEPDLAARTRECEEQFAPVRAMIEDMRRAGLPIPAVVAGGTPTFPMHAKRGGVELSPGTTVLWDHGYRTSFPDLDYLLAALLLTRVVSKPAKNLVCLDLGTKAVATEMPQPRLSLLGVGPHRIVGHNEEHLVIETADAGAFRPGDVLYAAPVHICPTVARYEAASVIEQGRCTGEWRVVARNRTITI
jgi:D-serine deaminase-like pyridoxal phosphate-dependent protein